MHHLQKPFQAVRLTAPRLGHAQSIVQNQHLPNLWFGRGPICAHRGRLPKAPTASSPYSDRVGCPRGSTRLRFLPACSTGPLFHLHHRTLMGRCGGLAAVGPRDWIGQNALLATTWGALAGCSSEPCPALYMEKIHC